MNELIPIPPKTDLLYFQIEPAQIIASAIRDKRPILLPAMAGTGKTYAFAKALAIAQAAGDLPIDGDKLVNVLWLTKKAIKIQTGRVLKQFGIKRFFVESYDAMRSGFGELWIDWETKVINGEIDYLPVWRKEDMPDIVILDECQAVKNENALCSKVIRAYCEAGGLCILSSATPFAKMSETYVIGQALGLWNTKTAHWKVAEICGRYDPDDYHPSIMERFNKILEEKGLIVRFKNVRFAKSCKTSFKIIEFDDPRKRIIYNEAFEEYQRIRAEAGRNPLVGFSAVLVAMLKFRQIAEILRSNQLAKYANLLVTQTNKQVIVASNFTATLNLVKSILTLKLKVPIEKISIIIGGQNEKVRQLNVDSFQKGLTDYCLLMLKAGGAGISLHNNDSNNPLQRPRHVILPLTWSPFDLVQVLGRAHRITSISNTEQEILAYNGTIELHVANIVTPKLSSLSKLIGRKESWVEIFDESQDDYVKEKMKEEITSEATNEDGENVSETLLLEEYNNKVEDNDINHNFDIEI